MNAPEAEPARLQRAPRVVVVVDLAGYTKAYQAKDDQEIAAFLDAYYAICDARITEAGGTLVKFMGDGCLAAFSADRAVEAVEVVTTLRQEIETLANEHGITVRVGANVHLTSVISGALGAGASRRFDIVGRGVNQTFLMGRGPGLRISEPVYRKLPSGARAPWNKHKPPAIYHLYDSGGVLEGKAKDAGTNAGRW